MADPPDMKVTVIVKCPAFKIINFELSRAPGLNGSLVDKDKRMGGVGECFF
jgi:hypothetical protein